MRNECEKLKEKKKQTVFTKNGRVRKITTGRTRAGEHLAVQQHSYFTFSDCTLSYSRTESVALVYYNIVQSTLYFFLAQRARESTVIYVHEHIRMHRTYVQNIKIIRLRAPYTPAHEYVFL